MDIPTGNDAVARSLRLSLLVSKANLNDRFRNSLATNFDQAVQPFNLTSHEKDALRTADWSGVKDVLAKGSGQIGSLEVKHFDWTNHNQIKTLPQHVYGLALPV